MHGLMTLQKMNEARAMAAVSLEVNGPPKPPTRLGKHYVWSKGDILLFTLESQMGHATVPLLVVDFAGERPSGKNDGTIRQVFTVQIRLPRQRKLRTLPTLDRRALKAAAGEAGIHGLGPILDDCYGIENP